MLNLSAPHLDLFRAASVAPEVVEALRLYDPALAVVWNARANRWGVMRFSQSKSFQVAVVQEPDGSYRPLTMAVVEDLKRDDLWKRARNANELSDRLAYEQELRDLKRQANFHDDMQHATRDNRVSLNRAGNLIRELFG